MVLLHDIRLHSGPVKPIVDLSVSLEIRNIRLSVPEITQRLQVLEPKTAPRPSRPKCR